MNQLTNWLFKVPGGSLPPLHKPAIYPILSKVHPVPSLMTHLLQIHSILSSLLRLRLPKGIFPSDIPSKSLYAALDNSICATCPAYLNPRQRTKVPKPFHIFDILNRAGSDDSMSASGSAGPGFNPWRGRKF